MFYSCLYLGRAANQFFSREDAAPRRGREQRHPCGNHLALVAGVAALVASKRSGIVAAILAYVALAEAAGISKFLALLGKQQ